MLKNTLLCAAALASIPTLAHADNWTQRDQAGTGLGWYARYIGDMQDRGLRASSESTAHDAADCRAVIEQYKADIGASEKIQSDEFKVLPGAEEVPDSGYPTKYAILWKNAPSICKTYAATRDAIVAAQPLEEVYENVVNQGVREENLESFDWYMIATDKDGTYLPTGTAGDTCSKAVDSAIEAGLSKDFQIKFEDGTSMTTEALGWYCKKAQDASNAFHDKAVAWAKAKYDEAAAVYKKVGIKGKRLELFMYERATEGSFLAKGCTDWVTSPKALAKAKKLFMWSEAANGVITVTTYKFKGNDYTVSDKEYDFHETAYKGCK
jgi:hypothetical protein